MLKRLFDLIASACGLLILSPLFLILAIWVKIDSIGPVFYRQKRITQYGRTYRIFKFRTMVTDADKNGPLVTREGDSRITNIGEKLRKCRLDEIPQLFNVLKGDMALIGPRPLLPRYLPYYTERERLRHSVRPGISGWAQVNGRNNLTWDNKLECDAYYAEHVSLWFDIKIDNGGLLPFVYEYYC